MTEVMALCETFPGLQVSAAVEAVDRLRECGYTLRSTTTVRENAAERMRRIRQRIQMQNAIAQMERICPIPSFPSLKYRVGWCDKPGCDGSTVDGVCVECGSTVEHGVCQSAACKGRLL